MVDFRALNKRIWGLSEVGFETTSFIGGTPYLDDSGFPVDSNGDKYLFLVQIDLSTVPALGLELPQEGYLQVFVADHCSYGSIDDGDSRIIMRILKEPTYTHDDCLETVANSNKFFSDEPPTLYEELMPKHYIRQYLEGTLDNMLPSVNLLEMADTELSEEESEQLEELSSLITEYPFYLGGYPSFVQSDFRENEEEYQDYTFVLGSYSGKSIVWGDNGNASFWVKDKTLSEESLESAVLYWDTH